MVIPVGLRTQRGSLSQVSKSFEFALFHTQAPATACYKGGRPSTVNEASCVRVHEIHLTNLCSCTLACRTPPTHNPSGTSAALGRQRM